MVVIVLKQEQKKESQGSLITPKSAQFNLTRQQNFVKLVQPILLKSSLSTQSVHLITTRIARFETLVLVDYHRPIRQEHDINTVQTSIDYSLRTALPQRFQGVLGKGAKLRSCGLNFSFALGETGFKYQVSNYSNLYIKQQV
jgi:hypothetical protein